MTAARTSLVEQKRLQWAKEREEIARLMGNRNSYPPDDRAYNNDTRGSFASESIGNVADPRYQREKLHGPLPLPLQCCADNPHLHHLHDPHRRRHHHQQQQQQHRYRSRYASTTSLRSLANSDFSFASLRDLDRCGATIGNDHPATTSMSSSCCSARSLLDLGHNVDDDDDDDDDHDDHRHRRRSYLPPIYKDELRCQQSQQKQEYERSQEQRMQQSRSSQQHRCSRNARHRSSAASNATTTTTTVVTSDQKKNTSSQTQATTTTTTTRTSGEEDREGETSGYASDNNNYDSLRLQQQQQHIQDHVLPCHVNQSSSMSPEKTWRNPYCNVDENSRPPSRNLPTYRSSGGGGAGEFNRQRWGSVWGQDVSRDPPPPSWLERGLSRLDHNSQVLVITHDSASSPSSDGGQSSTGSSYGSSSSDGGGGVGGAKSTYLRGQNQPIDAAVLQERETKRQKALELQQAIKRQLEDRERGRKEERENELREQRAEEERLRRQQSLEKQRIEEEKRLQREREAAKLKKSRAMQEVLEAAERQAKEDKQLSRRRKQQQQQQEEDGASNNNNNKTSAKSSSSSSVADNNKEDRVNVEDKLAADERTSSGANESSSVTTRDNGVTKTAEESQQPQQQQVVDLPVSQEVTIVLSGRIDDPELLLRNAPLKLVNLVLNAANGNSPRTGSPRSSIGNTAAGLGALLQGLSQAGQVILHAPPLSPRAAGAAGASNCTTPRLLTPSKYRMGHRRRGGGGGGGRECGTQTDCEADPSSTDYGIKEEEEDENDEREDRKDARNTGRRELEKSTSTTGNEDSTGAASKSFPSRAKAQKRTSLESRPRWNANRPGTRYRTQSEKDPHYQQRRMRLTTRRSRRTETSDEGCSSDFYRRSPSPVASRRPTRKQQQQQQQQQRQQTSVGNNNNNTIVKAKLSRNSVLARRGGGGGKRRSNQDDYNENDNVDDDCSMDSLTSLVPLQTDKNGRINIQRLDDAESSSYSNNTNDRNVWCSGGGGGGGGGSDLLSHLTSLRNGLMAKKKEWDLQECPVTPLTELY